MDNSPNDHFERIEFEQIYSLHSTSIYSNIYKIVRDAELARDVFQEVFLCLWQHLCFHDKKEAVVSWLFVVSRNKALTCLRQQEKVTATTTGITWFPDSELTINNSLDYAPGIDEEEKYHQQLVTLQKAIQHLSPKRKQVFVLCRLQGMPVNEVAEVLNTRASTIKEYLKQSNRLLRKYVATKV